MFTLLLVSALHAATPAAVAAYAEARLYRSAFAVSENGVTLTKEYDPAAAPLPWGVFDGRGNLLSAEAFADQVNDAGMLARFRKEDRKAKGTNTALTVLAIVVVAAGGSADGNGAASPSGPPSKDSPQQTASWTALVSGRQVPNYYTAELVDQLIVSFNASLRRKLGLSVEEAAALEGAGG
ncbi:hypothetical protein LBMAG42_35430 [Deltaproteobacteria bacterium]|nr:hypothetical protein LBMAG42_35430 [Deltaproteobacteria bacterium]